MSSEDATSGRDGEITQDTLFDILSSSRRRFALRVLKSEGELELTELAEHVAALENEIEVTDLSKQQRKRVYVSLYQTHVPKLRDAGLVRYDEDEQLVSLRSEADSLGRYLGNETEPFPWQYVYVAVVLVGFVLVSLSTAGLAPFDALPESFLALGLAVALLAVAAAHTFVWLSGRTNQFVERR